MEERSKLLAGLDRLEQLIDAGPWYAGHECRLSRLAAHVDDYYGRNTTPLQAELCKTLGKPAEYGWLMDWTAKETTTLADVKKLIADTRARLQNTTV